MLLTGEQDYRTPISESEQFYQALKIRRVDTALVRVPDAPHAIIVRPSLLIAKVNYILAWFEKDPEAVLSTPGPSEWAIAIAFTALLKRPGPRPHDAQGRLDRSQGNFAGRSRGIAPCGR